MNKFFAFESEKELNLEEVYEKFGFIEGELSKDFDVVEVDDNSYVVLATSESLERLGFPQEVQFSEAKIETFGLEIERQSNV